MPKYRVELSRTIGQEAVCYVDARCEEYAMDTAMDWAIEGDLVWHNDDDEPHNVCVEAAVLSEDVDSRRPRTPQRNADGSLITHGYPKGPPMNRGTVERQFAADAGPAKRRRRSYTAATSCRSND